MNFKPPIIILLVIYFISFITRLSAQDISSDFSQSEYINILHDYGICWEMNTSFKPHQWNNLNESIQNDSSQFPTQWMLDDLKTQEIQQILPTSDKDNILYSNAWFGTLLQYSNGNRENFQKSSSTLYGYFLFKFKYFFKAWLYPRITTNQYSLPHYTGKPRPHRRAGFNTGETDMAGIGYFGTWVQFWFCRGRQNWGAMSLDNLALSEKSAAYDQGTLQLIFNNLRLRYFHGYLETLENNNHRYITGRGIEYNNQRNLIIGAHEVVIYSGVDRPIDLAYMNPISTHLEVELNQRDNRSGGTRGGNAIWQLVLDWMPVKRLRFSANLLADEIVIDKFEREEGRPHALAYQIRLARSIIASHIAYTLFTEYNKVGTYTLRHGDGINNFVSRGIPLGTELGSDSDQWQIGARVITPCRLISTFRFGKKRSGVQNLLQNLYEPNSQFVDVPFPSGIVNETTFFRLDVGWYPRENIRIYIQTEIAESNLEGNLNYFLLSLDAYFPTYFEI